jgi:putative ABC transport system ATP-binding protein
MEPIVRAVHLHKTYDSGAAVRVHALRGVDLEIPPGEMVAVMGPSGCGKTTLLNCLSGLDDVTEGEIFVEGVNLSDMGDDRRTGYRAKRMGFVFQSYNLLPVLTARENAELPLLVGGVPYRQAREVARRMLALVGLEDFGDHKPAEMSAGQQQRVAIARALVNKPAIVWADEPTGNLDSETSAQIMELLARFNRENGQTFVVVTHDAAVASRAHRILKMKNGQIVEQVRAG